MYGSTSSISRCSSSTVKKSSITSMSVKKCCRSMVGQFCCKSIHFGTTYFDVASSVRRLAASIIISYKLNYVPKIEIIIYKQPFVMVLIRSNKRGWRPITVNAAGILLTISNISHNKVLNDFSLLLFELLSNQNIEHMT